MTANPYAEWSTQPDPKHGFPRGVHYGQDILQHLESLPPDTRFTHAQGVAFLKACGVSAIKLGGVPVGEIKDQPVVHLGTLVAAIRQRYAELETAAKLAADSPRFVAETEFPIPLDWELPDVLHYLLSLPGNTLILYERAWLFLRHCGIEDARKRLHPQFDVRRGPPGKEVGILIGIIRAFEEEERRRSEAPVGPSSTPFVTRYRGGVA